MKPILMNTEMVKAILAGRKTVTRRLIKPQPKRMLNLIIASTDIERSDKWIDDESGLLWTPPCCCGDVLYVRETWCENGDYELYPFETEKFWYKADEPDKVPPTPVWFRGWRPSIHMPKEAARIFLRVTNVRVERLKDVTVEGILEEGIDTKLPPICESSINGNIPNDNQRALMDKMSEKEREEYIQDLARHTYMGWCYYADKLFRVYEQLWNSTIKKSDLGKYGWDANPYIWCISFERITKEEAINYAQ